ncbi:UNVERIFIED_CONTAM: hypothetical protein FKN15_033958 [Acipenser sinensis]
MADTDLFMECEEEELEPWQQINDDVVEDSVEEVPASDSKAITVPAALPSAAAPVASPVSPAVISAASPSDAAKKTVVTVFTNSPVATAPASAPVAPPPVAHPVVSPAVSPVVQPAGQQLILTQGPGGLGTMAMSQVLQPMQMMQGTGGANQPIFITTQFVPLNFSDPKGIFPTQFLRLNLFSSAGGFSHVRTPPKVIRRFYLLDHKKNSKAKERAEDGSSDTHCPLKRKRRSKTFQSCWKSDFDWIKESKQGRHFAYCSICCLDFSVQNQGLQSAEQHGAGDQHVKNAERRELEPNPRGDAPLLSKTQTEAAFVSLLRAQNIAPASWDPLLKFFKKHCRESGVVKELCCDPSLSRCIAEDVLGPQYQSAAVTECRRRPFCVYLATDLAADGTPLLFVLVGFFQPDLARNVVRFLDMLSCSPGSEEALIDGLKDTFTRHKIPSAQLVAFYSHSSISATEETLVLKQINPRVLNMGHLFHLADLACGSGVRALEAPVEELLSDIHLHWSSSQEGQHNLQQAFFLDVELSETFTLANKGCLRPRTDKTEVVCGRLQSQELRVTFLFLKHALGPLGTLHRALRSREGDPAGMQRAISSVTRVYAGRLLLPGAAMLILKGSSDLTALDDPKNYLPWNEISTGPEVERYLQDQHLENSVTESHVFHQAALFYSAVLKEMLGRSPLGAGFLKGLTALLEPHKVSQRDMLGWDAQLGVCGMEEGSRLLKEEFFLYQKFVGLQQTTRTEAAARDSSPQQYWSQVFKDMAVEGLQLPLFERLVLALLCLPLSLRESERVVGRVRESKTALCRSVNLNTLKALLAIGANEDRECYAVQHSSEVLEACRKLKELRSEDPEAEEQPSATETHLLHDLKPY